MLQTVDSVCRRHMHPIRTLRTARKMMITELAVLSGVSARALGAAEYGITPLDTHDLQRVAHALQVNITQLAPPIAVRSPSHWRPFAATLLCVAMLGIVALFGGEFVGSQHQVAPAHAAAAKPTLVVLAAIPTVSLAPTQVLPATSVPLAPSITAVPAQLPDGMPRACPLLAAPEHVLVTQGYGEGTHAPIGIAGAIDLGIDGDGDQYADPSATDGVVVLATNAGIAHVYLDSWPGGNVIRIVDDTSGWSSLYAHLAVVGISDGQRVDLGQPIGRVGSTGMASGPHLHYEVWFGGENRDPTGIEGCWHVPG